MKRDSYAHGASMRSTGWGATHVPGRHPVFISIHPSAAPVSSAGDRLFSSTEGDGLDVAESRTGTASSPTLVDLRPKLAGTDALAALGLGRLAGWASPG